MPHVKDDFGRFTATESLAYNNQFLQQPVIDIWAYKLKRVLEEKFETYLFPSRHYNVQPVIDVPMAYYYRQKGLLRTVGGALNDFVRLRFRRFYERLLVLSGFQKRSLRHF